MQCFGQISLSAFRKLSTELAATTGKATTVRLDPWPSRAATIVAVDTMDSRTGDNAGERLARAVFVSRDEFDGNLGED